MNNSTSVGVPESSNVKIMGTSYCDAISFAAAAKFVPKFLLPLDAIPFKCRWFFARNAFVVPDYIQKAIKFVTKGE